MRRAVPIASVLLCSATAHASGFDAPQVGSQQSGPLTTDAAAVYHNPGQLGYLSRPEFSFGAGVIVGAVSYERERLGQYQFEDNLEFAEPIDPANIDASKTGTAPRVNTIPVGPTFDLFVAIPAIPERLAFGLGIYVPYAALLDWPDGGAQRWAAQDVTLLAAHTTLSAGVKLHKVISFGAGVSYVVSFLRETKVQDFAAVRQFGDGLAREPINQANDFGPQAPSTVRELDVLARPIDIGGVAHGVSFNAGFALRPIEKLSLAVVYQHGARLRYRGDFKLNMDDEFFTQDLAAQGLRYPRLVEGTNEIEIRLPKRITLGAGYQIVPRFRLEGVVSYVFYQDFERVDVTLKSPDLEQPALGIASTAEQAIDRDWTGTVHAEFMGKIEATKKLRVSALLGYHSPAAPQSTIDAASPDGHRLIFGGGIGYTVGPRFQVLGDFEGQAIIPRTVDGSDFDLGNGNYRLFLGNVAIHFRFRFGKDKKIGPSPNPTKPEPEPEPEPAPAPEPEPEPDSTGPSPPPPPPPAPSSNSPAKQP